MPEKEILKMYQSAEETTEPEIVQINGTIPEWLEGNFLQIGPAKWELDNGQFTLNHMIDGFSMISKFSIDSSKQEVLFEKKFLQSDAYKRALVAKRPVFTEFGTQSYPDPGKSFFSKMISACLPIELSDNNTENLFQLGNEVFATSETCYFRSIDPCSLTSGEKYDSNKCFGLNVDSPHPITDENGVTWQMGNTFMTGLKYNIVKIPPLLPNQSVKDMMKKSKIITSINSSWTGMMSYSHQAFTLTKNYIIFIEQPFVINISKAAKSIIKGSPKFSEYVEWRPELKNRFYVIEKESGKIIKKDFYASQPFFFMHYINAYEENNQIVLDLCSYENVDFLFRNTVEALRSGYCNQLPAEGTAHRYVLPLTPVNDTPENINLVEVKSEAEAFRRGSTIILTPEIISEVGVDYPIVSKKVYGKKNNYFFGSGTNGIGIFRNKITKFNTKMKTKRNWIGSETQFPGEPQLILNPNGKTEDDGILISVVTDEKMNANDFIVFIDATTMLEIGRAQFKSHLPIAMHGLFIPKENLDTHCC